MLLTTCKTEDERLISCKTGSPSIMHLPSLTSSCQRMNYGQELLKSMNQQLMLWCNTREDQNMSDMKMQWSRSLLSPASLDSGVIIRLFHAICPPTLLLLITCMHSLQAVN